MPLNERRREAAKCLKFLGSPQDNSGCSNVRRSIVTYDYMTTGQKHMSATINCQLSPKSSMHNNIGYSTPRAKRLLDCLFHESFATYAMILLLSSGSVLAGPLFPEQPPSIDKFPVHPSPFGSANRPLAGGIPGYQGFPLVAINPVDSTKLVASAISGQAASTDSQCNVLNPEPNRIKVSATAALFGSSDGGNTWVARCAPWNPFILGGIPNANTWFETSPAVTYNSEGVAIAAYVLSSQQTVENPDGTTTAKGVGSAIVIAESTDNGNSWNPAGIVDDNFSNTGVVYSNTKIAVDTTTAGAYSHHGRTYVASVHGSFVPSPLHPVTGDILVFWADSTNSWTTKVLPYDFGDAPGSAGAAPSIAVGLDGTVYVSFNIVDTNSLTPCGAEGIPDTSVLYRSTDGGNTWKMQSTVDAHQFCSYTGYAGGALAFDPPAQYYRGGNAFVSLDIDRNPQSPYAGNIYAVFADYEQPTSPGVMSLADTEIYLRRSTDGGSTWGQRVRVNDDNLSCTSSTCPAITHFLPALSIDQSDGSVNMTWYDTRDYPNPIWVSSLFEGVEVTSPVANPATKIYYARSIDGGVTIEPNVAVTDSGEDFVNQVAYSDELRSHWGALADDPDSMGHMYQYGDYIGIVASNRQVHPVWTDTRDFWPQKVSYSPVFYEDVATDTIENCSSPIWSGLVSGAGLSTHIALSWMSVQEWGTNATSGTITVFRKNMTYGESPVEFGPIEILPANATFYEDVNAPQGETCYEIVATNNCPGTKLTPMSVTSNTVCFSVP